MSYPGTINDTAISGRTADMQASGQGNAGMIEYSANEWFQFLGDELIDLAVRAYFSSNQGQTWTVADAANSPIPPNANAFDFATVRDGATAYVIFGDPTGGGYQVNAFSLASGGAWGAQSTGAGIFVAPNAGTAKCILAATRRGASDMLVIYNGTAEVVAGNPRQRVYYSIWTGSTFSAAVMLGGQAGVDKSFFAVSALYHSVSLLSHLFYSGRDPLVQEALLFHVSLDSGGSFGTAQQIDDSLVPANVTGLPYNCGIAIEWGTRIGLTVRRSSTGVSTSPFQVTLAFFFAVAAANPTWHSSTVRDVAVGFAGQEFLYNHGAAYVSGNIVCAWTFGNEGDFRNSLMFYAVGTFNSGANTFTWTDPPLIIYNFPQGWFLDQLFITALTTLSGKAGVVAIGSNFDAAWKMLSQFSAFTPSAGGASSGNLYFAH